MAGCLAVDAHGAALPAEGEAHVPGQTFGSLSNLVTSLTAVVWNGSEYALKTYARSDAEIKPLLTHLGRTFLTSVTLQAAPNYRMRCVSHTDIGLAGTLRRPRSVRTHLREVRPRKRSRRSNLVPLHRTPVDEGVVTCTHQAAVLA